MPPRPRRRTSSYFCATSRPTLASFTDPRVLCYHATHLRGRSLAPGAPDPDQGVQIIRGRVAPVRCAQCRRGVGDGASARDANALGSHVGVIGDGTRGVRRPRIERPLVHVAGEVEVAPLVRAGKPAAYGLEE